MIWRNLSLRSRICVLLTGMFFGALMFGAALLYVFASPQLIEENAPGAQSAAQVAGAVNKALGVATNPDAVLAAFAGGLGKDDGHNVLVFTPSSALPAKAQSNATREHIIERVPGWFVNLLNIPDMSRQFPLFIAGNEVGALTFDPDLSADLFEKWIGLLAIVISALALAAFAVAITFFTAGAVTKPIRRLGQGLLRLGEGDYSQDLSCAGPPEVRTCGEAANNLANKLGRLQSENRFLLQQLVEIQEEERRELSRELHDELGPMLFAIRANVTALAEQTTADERDRREARDRVMQAADGLQQSTRRILNQLHPLYMEDIGFHGSIERVVRDARRERPQIDVLTNIDLAVEQLNQLLRRTLYRTIQESMTNAVKHSDATKVQIETTVRNDTIHLEVRDNGSSWNETPAYGRGLTGLRERIRALGGFFDFSRCDGWTCVTCRVPVPSDEVSSRAPLKQT